MTNIEIILVLLMAGGFGYIITKLKKIEDIASLSVSMQLGKIVAETLDEDTIICSLKEEEEEDE